jgi:hypothetical protein
MRGEEAPPLYPLEWPPAMKEETKPSATKQAASQHKPGVSVSIPKTQVFTELSNGKPYIVRSD